MSLTSPIFTTPDSITKFRGDTSRLKNIVAIAERVTPEFYKKEQERIFKRAWLPVAVASDVAQSGSFVTADVPPLKASLLIVRGEDDRIGAFHNICRHRGDKLVHSASGCQKAFTCGFHAWTYCTEGKLIGITDETQFPGIEREKFG